MIYRLVAALAALFLPAVASAQPRPVSDSDYAPVRGELVELGQLLFYDPILSGNRAVACATCHHPAFGTADGVSLSLGDGAKGLGPQRRADPENLPEQHIPRNAPALFNLGAREFTVMFHDGRIEVDPARKSGLRTPLGEDMVVGFDSLLSAQTMFPVLSADEMAGHYGENDISRAVRQGLLTGPDGAWARIARRVSDIPEYQQGFARAEPEIAAGRDITFADISNAIAAFIEEEWRSDTSAFDAYLRDGTPLPPEAEEGRQLFYGAAGCSECHSGPFQTDHGFHALGFAQIGPGKAARFESHARDEGRMRVTGRAEDRFAFRTPSLRNVTATAPYGHSGSYADLPSVIAAHWDPAGSFAKEAVILPQLASAKPWRVVEDATESAAIDAARVAQPALSEDEITRIIAFLGTLEDPVALGGRRGIPQTVPSGLPVDRLPD